MRYLARIPLATASLLFGCREAPKPEPVVAPVVSVSAKEIQAAAPSPTASAKPAQSAVRSAPGVACGAKQCVSGEVCCFSGEGLMAAECVKGHSSGSVVAACESVKKVHNDVTITAAVCDESSDCTGGKVCCSHFTGGAEERICATNAAKECTLTERCVSGSKCKTSGTQCVDEKCVKTTVKIPCGDETCSEATPVCSVATAGSSKARCTAKFDGGDGAFVSRYCATSRDCPTGAYCVTSNGFAQCDYVGPTTNASVACLTQSDCDEPRVTKAIRAVVGNTSAKVQCLDAGMGIKACTAH